jgi:hypothetical protein
MCLRSRVAPLVLLLLASLGSGGRFLRLGSLPQFRPDLATIVPADAPNEGASSRLRPLEHAKDDWCTRGRCRLT